MTIQDGQDGIQRPMIEEQPEDNNENIDPVLLIGEPRSVHLSIMLGHVVYNAICFVSISSMLLV
jgi:hypothetical protein